jgi:hypothetical protein
MQRLPNGGDLQASPKGLDAGQEGREMNSPTSPFDAHPVF